MNESALSKARRKRVAADAESKSVMRDVIQGDGRKPLSSKGDAAKCHTVMLSCGGHDDDEPRGHAGYVPFPTGALPSCLKALVEAGAASIGVDPAMVALPGLVTLAAAIGNTRRVSIKPDWSEPSILWGLTVADSSTRKSPAFKLATAPIVEAQKVLFREHHDELRRQEEAADGGRVKPLPCKRVAVEDTTLDAMAPILRDNPRGLLVGCDELDVWFQSFTRYSGGGASDQPRWLKMYNGEALTVDRKGGGSVYAPAAVASIGGTIQPGVLARAMTVQARESGLCARLLIAKPPRLSRRWIEESIPQGVLWDYGAVVKSLLAIPLDECDSGPRPRVIPLTPDARSMFREFMNLLGEKADDAGEADVRAVYGKLEGTAARLALIHELASEEGNPANVAAVGADAMTAGIALAEWFSQEIVRVYRSLEEPEDQKAQRELIEYIRLKGGIVGVRELQRHNCRRYPKAEAARAALDSLARAGLGEWCGKSTFRASDSPPA